MSTAYEYAPRYTVEDYRQWQGDWELWDGIAIAMSPSPFGRHQAVATALVAELRTAIKANSCNATALMELDWIIGGDTVVRPDVMVVCGRAPERYQETVPSLVAEVLSESTRQNDQTFKRELYAREGVAIYLIVDPDSNTVEHLILTSDNRYESAETSDCLKLKVCQDCQIEVQVFDLFAE